MVTHITTDLVHFDMEDVRNKAFAELLTLQNMEVIKILRELPDEGNVKRNLDTLRRYMLYLIPILLETKINYPGFNLMSLKRIAQQFIELDKRNQILARLVLRIQMNALALKAIKIKDTLNLH